MKLNTWQIPVTIVCLIIGLLLSLQFQTVSDKPSMVASLKNQDLVNMIKELEDANSTLEDEVDNLRSEISQIQANRASGEATLQSLQQELAILRDATGLTEKKGNGIILVIDDNKSGADAAKAAGLDNYFPDEFIVHYKSLLYIVNELRGVSNAISINNQRIVANTDIRCVGTVILVNTTRLAPPYEIKAIGNPERLHSIITSSYEYSYLSSRGFPVKISKETDLVVSPYRGSYRFNFAQPVKEGE